MKKSFSDGHGVATERVVPQLTAVFHPGHCGLAMKTVAIHLSITERKGGNMQEACPNGGRTRRPLYSLRGKKADAQFAQLVAPSQERVYRLALRITSNVEDAKDVQQGTLLKAYRKLGQFEGRSQFNTWISRIAINEALMCLRKRRSAAYVPLEQALPPNGATQASSNFHSVVEGPERAYARKELRDLLAHAIGTLRPTHRAIFLLRGIERLSTKQTAKVLHISEGIVKARLRRARTELRSYLRNALQPHVSFRITG